MKSVVLSDRTMHRALEQMKAIYAAHSAVCPEGKNCRVMVNLKSEITSIEEKINKKKAL